MPPADPPVLSRDRVIRHALATLDTREMDALSIRTLASELGVTPMAIYWHVKDKNEILDGVLDATLAEVTIDGSGEDPFGALTTLARRYRQAFARHTGAARVLAVRQGRAAPGPATVRLLTAGYELLRGAGLDEGRSLSALMMLSEFLMGAVVTEAAGDSSDLATAVGARSMPSADERFEFGLGLLVDGLRAAARPRHA